MKKTLMLAIVSSLALAACGDKAAKDGESGKAASNEPAEKPQPGSWTQKIEVTEMTGPNVSADAKDKMNAVFATLSGQTVCMTPELAAQQDMSKNMSEMASQGGNCTFERQIASGKNVDFAATCKGPMGDMKIEGKGTSGAAAQDMTLTITGLNPDGSVRGKMTWHVTGERKGECGPNDIALPPPPAPAAKS